MSNNLDQPVKSTDVLLANQLYYKSEAAEYDKKNHVNSQAIQSYYRRLFDRFIFAGCPPGEVGTWLVCDVGCGTGFLETMLAPKVGSIVSLDATLPMLQEARRKFPGASIAWVMAVAESLPLATASFDLVCSNAMLHHLYEYREVVAKMVSLIKPGGKLFIGYEPNAIPYRLFWPLLKAAAKIVPEHRNREQIRRASGQEDYDELKGVDIHELAEYHIFQGTGIHPFRLRDDAIDKGVSDAKVHFTSLYQAALLRDSGIPLPINSLPEWIWRISGRLSLSFCLTGTKR